MSCYIENENSVNSGTGSDTGFLKEKFLVEFVAPSEGEVYRLPPIRLLIGDDAVLETVFSNFLALRNPDNSIQLLSKESY